MKTIFIILVLLVILRIFKNASLEEALDAPNPKRFLYKYGKLDDWQIAVIGLPPERLWQERNALHSALTQSYDADEKNYILCLISIIDAEIRRQRELSRREEEKQLLEKEKE